MITLIDIQDAVRNSLYKRFNDGYYFYVEKVKENLIRPAFFIEAIPESTENNINYKSKLVKVDIMYFSENQSIEENLIMVESLEEVFKSTLIIKDRILNLKNLDYMLVNNILHCIFTLDFNENVELVEVNTKTGLAYLPEHELNEELGYTKNNIEEMEELEIY